MVAWWRCASEHVKHAASGCHLPKGSLAVRRAVDRTGTSLPVPLVFGALGAIEIVTLHFRSEAKKGEISWIARAWGACRKYTGWSRGEGSFGNVVGRELMEGHGAA